MDKYLVINLSYIQPNACNLFSICYLCFIGSEQASKLYKVDVMETINWSEYKARCTDKKGFTLTHYSKLFNAAHCRN